MDNLISKNDKIFIAGSKGMVGSAISRTFQNSGYGDKKKGGGLLLPARKDLNLLNYEELKSWFELNKPNVVIIAAAKVGGIFANSSRPLDFLLENLKIQTNLIELSFLNKVKRLVFLGSSCIYPKFAEQPLKEDCLLSGKLEETNEWYAVAKIAGIKLCEALRIQEGFDAISLMPTNLYGPGDNYHPQNSHVMAALLRKFYEAKINNLTSITCWGTGNPLREFMHVDDLGEAVKFVLEKWDPPLNKDLSNKKNTNFFLNVGTGKEISIKDLAYKIASIVGYKGDINWDNTKPDGTPRKLMDVSKINDLGWSASISLNEGIIQTLDQFKKENQNNTLRI